MESHPSSDSERTPKRRRTDATPLDAAWLEKRALQYAARWETNRAGVERLLERKVHERCARSGEDPSSALDLIPSVAQRLVERGYVDDERYARQLLEKLRRQGRSRAQIRAQLRSKGVDEGTFETVCESLDGNTDLDAAWRTAKRRRLGPYCLDPGKRERERQRHLGMLARQGFSREIAIAVIDADTPPEPC